MNVIPYPCIALTIIGRGKRFLYSVVVMRNQFSFLNSKPAVKSLENIFPNYKSAFNCRKSLNISTAYYGNGPHRYTKELERLGKGCMKDTATGRHSYVRSDGTL